MALPKYAWPVIAVVVGAGAILLSNRDPVGPNGQPLVRDGDGYQREGQIANDLTNAILVKARRGEEVSNEERAKLLEAVPHLQAMNAFVPTQVGPYFALGQIYQIRGETFAARKAYDQAVSNEISDIQHKGDPAWQETVTEAKALLSETLLDEAIEKQQAGAKSEELKAIRERALSLADQAVKEQPKAPRYLAARASALLALNRDEEAKAAVLEAAATDPNHFKVKPLMSLLGL